MKLPYEYVADEVWKISREFDRTEDGSQQCLVMDAIDDWLTTCGWSHQEFDVETLKRVDARWADTMESIWKKGK